MTRCNGHQICPCCVGAVAVLMHFFAVGTDRPNEQRECAKQISKSQIRIFSFNRFGINFNSKHPYHHLTRDTWRRPPYKTPTFLFRQILTGSKDGSARIWLRDPSESEQMETQKNIENIQNTISDDASLLLMSRCWHPLKGRFKAKEIQQRVCFKTCHHLSKRERMRVSLLVPGQRFCRDCIFGHPCRTGLWWKPGHWKQHCMVAWHSAFRQGYTSHTQHQWMSWTPSTRISQKHTLPFSTQDVHRNGCGHISVTCSFTSWGLSYPKR